MTVLAALGFFALHAAAGLGWGRFVRSRLVDASDLPASARAAVDLVLGAAVLSAGTTLLAYTGCARPAPLWIWLIAAGVSGAVLCARSSGPGLFDPSDPSRGRLDRIGPWLLAALFLANLAAALAPPASYDALSYHLAVPRIQLDAGGLVDRPDITQSYGCGLQHMLFLLALGTAGEPACAVVVALGNLALLLAVLGAARRAGLGETSWAAPATVVAMPFFALFAKNLEIDLALATALVLTLFWFEEWQRRRSPGALLLVALLAGIAGGTKYTGYLLAPFLLAARLWLEAREPPRRWAACARDLALLALIPLAVNLPQLARNAVWTGNPFHPYLSGLLGGAPVTEMLTSDPAALRWTDLLALPWTLSTRDARVGPLFALFLPTLLVFRPRAGFVAVPLAFAALALPALWALCPSFWRWSLGRFQAPFLIPLCVGVAIAFACLRSSPGRSGRTAALVLLGINLLLGVALLAGGTLRRLPAVFGLQSREAFLERELRMWKGWEFINRSVPPEARVGLVDPLCYYVRPPFTVLHAHFDLTSFSGAEALLADLRRRKIAYLALSRDATDLNTRPFREFVERHPGVLDESAVECVYRDEGYAVYRLR